MAKKRIGKEIKKKINLFAEEIKRRGIKIDYLILFGSQTKGHSNPHSDIDLCIVSSKFGKDPINEAAKLRLIAYPIDWRIEPHVFTPEEMKEKENPFVYEVLSTGNKIL